MLRRYEAPESESDEGSKRRRTGSEPSASSSPSSGGYSSSSSESESEGLKQPADLLMSQLAAMNEGKDEDSSTYAKKAKNPERIKSVLGESCCKSKCKRKLNFRLVFRMVCYFWALSKTSQDCILWSMQNRSIEQFDNSFEESGSDSESSGSSENEQTKMSWSIEGRVLLEKSQTTLLQTTLLHLRPLWPGIKVCRQAFIRLLGISPARLVRTRHTFKGVDGRAWSCLPYDFY